MTEQTDSPLEITENPLAPEWYAEAAISFARVGAGSNVSITLVSPRWNTSKNAFDHAIVGRVVLPVSGAQGLAVGLFDFLKSHGLDPASSSGGPAVQ